MFFNIAAVQDSSDFGGFTSKISKLLPDLSFITFNISTNGKTQWVQ